MFMLEYKVTNCEIEIGKVVYSFKGNNKNKNIDINPDEFSCKDYIIFRKLFEIQSIRNKSLS